MLKEKLSQLVIPTLGFLGGILLSYWVKANLAEGTIISLICTCTTAIIQFNYTNGQTLQGLKNNGTKLEEKINQVMLITHIFNAVTSAPHPYFNKIYINKLNEFININRELFNGTYKTTPLAKDTFGIEGLHYTKTDGLLKGLSSLNDYWEDSFVDEYLKVQMKLISEKHVKIDRIFVINNLTDKITDMMDMQFKGGINVYFIKNDFKYIDPEWLHEDYLIQDDKILIDITKCQTKAYAEDASETELITVDAVLVNEKIDRFNRIREKAHKYTGKSKSSDSKNKATYDNKTDNGNKQ